MIVDSANWGLGAINGYGWAAICLLLGALLLAAMRWAYSQGRKAQALKQDALRYRWLRDRDLETLHKGGVFAGATPDNVVLNGCDLDERIDFALSGHHLKGDQP
jgi:hypothetical protein